MPQAYQHARAINPAPHARLRLRVGPRRFAAFGGLTAPARVGVMGASGRGTSVCRAFRRGRFSPSARIEQGTGILEVEEAEIHRIRRAQIEQERHRLADMARATIGQAKAFSASPQGKQAMAEIAERIRRLS